MPANSYSRLDSTGSESISDKGDDSILGTSPGTSHSSMKDHSDIEDDRPRYVLSSLDGQPGKVVSLEEVQNALNSVDNMTLAHEVAVNPDFRLKPYEPPANSLEGRIKEMTYKAFWAVFRENLEMDPPCYDYAIKTLADIKAGFTHIIAKNDQKTLDHINEILDADVIKQQVDQGVLDFKSYANFIIDTMAKSCAPVRDEQVAKLREIEDIVDMFRGILETMSVLKLDMANCLLDSLRKDVIAHSISYEKEKFQEFLKLYTLGFPIAENWLHQYKPTDTSSPRWEFLAVIDAFIGLLDWDSTKKYPETISIDEVRFGSIAVKCMLLSFAASVVAIASSIPIIGQSQEIKLGLAREIGIILGNVKTNKDLEETIENVWLQVKTYVTRILLDKNAVMDDLTEQSLKQQIILLANKDSTIRTLMWKRLTVFFRLSITMNNPPPIPPGYTEFSDIVTLSIAFKRVALYNYSVFGEFYHEVLHKDVPQPMPAPKATSIEEVD